MEWDWTLPGTFRPSVSIRFRHLSPWSRLGYHNTIGLNKLGTSVSYQETRICACYLGFDIERVTVATYSDSEAGLAQDFPLALIVMETRGLLC